MATGRALAATRYRIRTQISMAHCHLETAGGVDLIGVAGIARSRGRQMPCRFAQRLHTIVATRTCPRNHPGVGIGSGRNEAGHAAMT